MIGVVNGKNTPWPKKGTGPPDGTAPLTEQDAYAIMENIARVASLALLGRQETN